MPYKQYSDSYLLKQNKKEIIDLLRVAEHNFFAAEEGLQNSARFGAEVLAENAELKRLLKLAAEDIHSRDYYHGCVHESAEGKEMYLNCEYHNCYKWRYADEALKLIEG